MKALTWLPLLGLLFVGAAYADACPDGMITNPVGAGGQPQCVPGTNHQNWGRGGGSSGPKYARRWGAFAGDSDSGKIGLASGLPSKRKAEKAAIAHCQSKGGASCKVEMAYYDQCGVVAYGGGFMNTASAPTIEEASQIALKRCGAKSSDCKVYFSDCSYAEQVQ